MNLLQKYLKKCFVNDFSELSSEEKETFREWEQVLSGRKITDEDIHEFFNTEIEEIQVKLVNPNLSQREDVFLKMMLDMIRKIRAFTNSPKVEKEMLEQNINKLLK